MYENTTFSAEAAREDIAGQVNDISLDLADCSGCICDAISEIANARISIFTKDQIAYCRNHGDSVREAICEGLALSPCEYFGNNTKADYEDYEAHLGVAAAYMDNERTIYEELEDMVHLIIIDALADKYGDTLNTEAFEMICPIGSDIDSCGTIEEIKDSACAEYTAALEELAEDITA